MAQNVIEIVQSYIKELLETENIAKESMTLKEIGFDESSLFDIKVDIEDKFGFQIPDHEVDIIDFEMTIKQFTQCMEAIAEKYMRKL